MDDQNEGVNIAYKTQEKDILLMIPSVEQRFSHELLRT
ncbi:hypothetical protein [Polaromonas sp. CG9_12]|nr:hypothetical protein [Polaromonas sp. CG9_12]